MNKDSLPSAESNPDRETVSFLIIGSRDSITNTIHTLYRLGFAQISEWSTLLPAPQAGKVMILLTRQVAKN